MRLGTMLGDTLRSLFKRPITQQYPFVKLATPEHLRGKLTFDNKGCTGCGLCVKDCPANAIELIVNDKKGKRFVFRYHEDRCTYCGQCVTSCRFDCLNMGGEQWELASVSKEPFTITFGTEPDDQSSVEKGAQPDSKAPATA